MKVKSRKRRSRLVRKSADELPVATKADLDRLRRAKKGPIDTSEIPEQKHGFKRVRRDASGRLPRARRSAICQAILAELGRQNLTRYELCQRARQYCDTLSESAVYEFLRGQRQIGLVYLEAIMAALNLKIQPQPVHS